MTHARWSLAAKLVLMGALALALALASIGSTLWLTWQIEGGAAAVNEAGRMRMQTYRLAVMGAQGAVQEPVREQVARFDRVLESLRAGDPSRPLFVPWNDTTRAQFDAVRTQWAGLRQVWQAGQGAPELARIDAFVGAIDDLVTGIELQLSRWTALLHMFQLAMMALAIGSAVVLLYAGYLFVLDPVARLQRGLERVEGGDFAARVEPAADDEFGHLARGFNRMAENLQALYGTLEAKVREKTARLELQRERLAAMYDVSRSLADAPTLDDLARGFARQVREIARADAVAIRWSDEANQRYLLLATDCLPRVMVEAEQCLHAGSCHCGRTHESAGTRVIPIHATPDGSMGHCAQAGYQTLVSLPVALHQRVLGEIDLFFRGEVQLGDDERSLLETLAAHLASAMEGLRAQALEKESAVAQERGLLAQELHDSIAQSLAFLKIQVQLLRDARARLDNAAAERATDELDVGVRECYADVRELLVHFRTRTNNEDIEPALRTTLQKFELQTGLATRLTFHGHGLPLPADVQVQVLHIVQEALSNVRKHAGASQVWVDVTRAPAWRIEVRDDGRGFDPAEHAPDETHVGLRIMNERARRIGATVTVQGRPDEGAQVILSLPDQTTVVPDRPVAQAA